MSSFTSGPLKKRCYLNAKLDVYEDKIRTNLRGEEIPHNQYCHTTAVLQI